MSDNRLDCLYICTILDLFLLIVDRHEIIWTVCGCVCVCVCAVRMRIDKYKTFLSAISKFTPASVY